MTSAYFFHLSLLREILFIFGSEFTDLMTDVGWLHLSRDSQSQPVFMLDEIFCLSQGVSCFCTQYLLTQNETRTPVQWAHLVSLLSKLRRPRSRQQVSRSLFLSAVSIFSLADISLQIQCLGSLNLIYKEGDLFYRLHLTMKPVSIHFSFISLCFPSFISLLLFVFAPCFMNK